MQTGTRPIRCEGRDGVAWLSVREAARRLQLTTPRIYHLIADTRLAMMKFGGLYYVKEQDVSTYQRYRQALDRLKQFGRPATEAPYAEEQEVTK